MPQQTGVWTETFRIRSYEVDPSGHVSLPSICNFLQEAAGNHAERLGLSVDRLLEENLTWVLTRLHVEMDRYPTWRTDVRVETWPSGENGLFATREFVLYGEDGAPIGRATSAWLVLDVRRRRPVRLPAEVSALRVPDHDRPVADSFERLPAPGETLHERRFRVRYGDLDLNGHVNNVHYVEWAVETLPLEIVEGRRLRSLEVHFRAETTYGDTVLGRAAGGDDGSFHHRLVRESDERELALVRTRW